MKTIRNNFFPDGPLLCFLIVFTSSLSQCTQKKSSGKRGNDSIKKDSSIVIDKIKNLEIPYVTQQEQIISHTTFTLSYSEEYEQAKWVAYKLTAYMIRGETERKNDFRSDPLIQTGSALPDDYKNSGYDRGHLCPAGDRKWSEEAMSETFFMSNMSPQKPSFNRGIWKKLEEKVRAWADENEEIFVVTGGVLEKNLLVIGSVNKISAPKYFYKVILDAKESDLKAIAFVLPNEKSGLPLENYTVTIDSVEKMTGIDFFPLLPDSLEDILEGKIELEKWRF